MHMNIVLICLSVSKGQSHIRIRIKICGGYCGGRKRTLQKFMLFFIYLREPHGGGGGIRTHGRLSPTSVFKTGAFNHSATPPTGTV